MPQRRGLPCYFVDDELLHRQSYPPPEYVWNAKTGFASGVIEIQIRRAVLRNGAVREVLDLAIFRGGLGDDLATGVGGFGADVEDPVCLGGDGHVIEVNVDEAIVNAVNL